MLRIIVEHERALASTFIVNRLFSNFENVHVLEIQHHKSRVIVQVGAGKYYQTTVAGIFHSPLTD